MPKDLFKVNSEQIFLLWRNFACSVLAIIANLILTNLLPVFCAPIVPLVLAACVYFFLYGSFYSKYQSCVIVPYTIFNIFVIYALLLVSINLLNVWTIIDLPYEMIFFDGIFIPTLYIAPLGLLISSIIYFRRRSLKICINCRLSNGSALDRGRIGIIYHSESEFQMKLLMRCFAIIAIVVWTYYIYAFTDINLTSRDKYIFIWLACIVYLSIIFFYGLRCYNLFLDMKERNELLSPEEVAESGVRTYALFYVICGDYVYLTDHSVDGLRDDDDGDLLGSPFMTKRNMALIPQDELKNIIARMTGVTNGTMKFFYGRRVADAAGRRMLRYFYFLPGDIENYPELATKGQWISSDKLKTIYNNMPDRLTTSCLADISRIATIMITKKTYNEAGERRTKLTQYRPSFSLQEISDSNIDFQDDKWIRISLFNSDKRFFKLKRWWRSRWRRSNNPSRI